MKMYNLLYRNEKISIPLFFIIAFLFFVNSGFHINKVPAYVSTYITFYISFIYIFYVLLFKRSIKITKISIIAFIIVIYLLLSQLIIGGDILVTLASVITFLFYIISTFFLKGLDVQKIKKICNWILIYNSLLFFADIIYRLKILCLGISHFYILKQSILYSDTNAVGINATVLLFFSYYLYEKFKEKKYLFFTVLYSFFVFFSLSRAAIIATVLMFFVFISRKLLLNLLEMPTVFYRVKRNFFFSILLIVPFLIILFFLLVKVISFLLQDPSFLTKINIFEELISFWQIASIKDIFWGIGYDNAYLYLGRYAHNYLATYCIETGLIGFFLVTFFLFSVLYKTPKTFYILFPFSILGISYIGHTILNLFYCILAIIYFIEKKSFKKILDKKNYIKTNNIIIQENDFA